MLFLAIIPARFASTRFPGKPLAPIGGKPMIQHVCERASEVFEHCWVATDDPRISDAVRAFGGRVAMTSGQHRSGTDRAAEALAAIEHGEGLRFDVVVNIQGDEPFVAASQLEALRDCFRQEDTEIATLVKPFGPGENIASENSPKVVLGTDGRALYFSRSVVPFLRGVPAGEWPSRHTYYKHIGLYGYRADVLRRITRIQPSPLELAESLEQLRWLEHGYTIRTAVTDIETIAVDTPEDLEAAERFFAALH